MTTGARVRTTFATLLGLVLGLLMGAGPAAADEQPTILKSYGLDWIERIKEEAWPQPKDQRPVICLIDTGVAVTPDTPEDNPAGPIVARLAIDGGGGLPQGTGYPYDHGTQMASVIGAPRNDWGTVGVFPQAKIVSVRVTQKDAAYISTSDMEAGLRACRRWALVNGGLRLAAIVMAESGWQQRPADASAWQTAAAVAANGGGVFFAAAGNADNAQLVAPLAIDEIVTVGAGDDRGALCSFANRSQVEALMGPGCSAMSMGGLRWPAGSSAATAAVGALGAAIATRLPDSDVAARRDVIANAASAGPAGVKRINGELVRALFSNLVNESPAPVSDVGLTVGLAPGAGADDSVRTVLWRLKVRASWRKRWLTLTRVSHVKDGVIRVRLPGSGRAVAKRLAGRVVRLKVAARPRSIEVWAESNTLGKWRSLSTRVKLRK